MTDGDKYRGQFRKSRTQTLNCNNFEGDGGERRGGEEGRERERELKLGEVFNFKAPLFGVFPPTGLYHINLPEVITIR